MSIKRKVKFIPRSRQATKDAANLFNMAQKSKKAIYWEAKIKDQNVHKAGITSGILLSEKVEYLHTGKEVDGNEIVILNRFKVRKLRNWKSYNKISSNHFGWNSEYLHR